MNKVYATLSADIVDSTSLLAEDTVKLKESLEGFFPVMKSFCGEAWGRVVRGDSVECVIPEVAQSLRIALLLKCYVKMLELDSASRTMKKKGISSLEELISDAISHGVNVVACQMSMDIMGIHQEELIDGVSLGGVSTILGSGEKSDISLFI